MDKVLKSFKMSIEERVSKKTNKPYRMLVVEVDGKKTDYGFLTSEMEFALYKCGVKI